MGHYAQVLQNLTFIDKIVPYPLPLTMWHDYTQAVCLENAIENNVRAQDLHMTALFAKICGLPPPDNMLPCYEITPSENIWANEMFPRINGTKRACIQVGASGIARVYPRNQMGAVIGSLVRKGWEVFLLGAKGEIQLPNGAPPTLRNLSDLNLTMRQSAAVVNNADVFLGNDSALLHIAGALSVPAVGLYGPFPWKLRTAYCPTTFALQGSGECAPCFHHASATLRNHFPAHCPSRQEGFCQVLATIKPEHIVAKMESMARTIDNHPTAVVP
jgi:ADP-heptose:LPS heptosyltransferase